MLSFMFGVLGSVIFWLIYGCVSVVIGTALLRYLAREVWEWMKEGSVCAPFIAIPFVLCWPVIGAFATLYVVMKHMVGPMLIKLFIASGSIIPEIEIKKKENDETSTEET